MGNPNQNPSSYVRKTATGQVKTKPGVLRGMYVNSTSAGTIKIYDGTDNSGAVMHNTITPAIGFHNFGDEAFAIGCYVEIGGTLDCTLQVQ